MQRRLEWEAAPLREESGRDGRSANGEGCNGCAGPEGRDRENYIGAGGLRGGSLYGKERKRTWGARSFAFEHDWRERRVAWGNPELRLGRARGGIGMPVIERELIAESPEDDGDREAEESDGAGAQHASMWRARARHGQRGFQWPGNP